VYAPGNLQGISGLVSLISNSALYVAVWSL